MDATRVATRIASTEAIIDAYDAAILAFAANPIESYTIDTGQGLHRVQRSQVTDMIATRDLLMNQLATLCARAGQGGTMQGLPRL